jgi:hypothetical protein
MNNRNLENKWTDLVAYDTAHVSFPLPFLKSFVWNKFFSLWNLLLASSPLILLLLPRARDLDLSPKFTKTLFFFSFLISFVLNLMLKHKSLLSNIYECFNIFFGSQNVIKLLYPHVMVFNDMFWTFLFERVLTQMFNFKFHVSMLSIFLIFLCFSLSHFLIF